MRDTVARQQREPGVGATVNPTPVIEALEEEQLWSLGVLGGRLSQGFAECCVFRSWKSSSSLEQKG